MKETKFHIPDDYPTDWICRVIDSRVGDVVVVPCPRETREDKAYINLKYNKTLLGWSGEYIYGTHADADAIEKMAAETNGVVVPEVFWKYRFAEA